MKVLRFIVIFIFVESVLCTGNQCGEVFTDTTGHISASFQQESVSCKWTIVARPNELVIAKISSSGISFSSYPTGILTISHAVGSLTSTESVPNKEQSSLWIRGGKVTLSIEYSLQRVPNFYDYDCFDYDQDCPVYILSLDYEIIPAMKSNDCEETIQVKNPGVITLPYKSISFSDSKSIGCNVHIQLSGNQTLRADLVVDLHEANRVSLAIHDGDDETGPSLVDSQEYSTLKKTLSPKRNSIYVSYRFPHSIVFADKISLKLFVINSDLDCEFEYSSFCGWKPSNDRWMNRSMAFVTKNDERKLAGVASLERSGIVGDFSELDSSVIKTESRDLCVRVGYTLNNDTGSIMYILFVQQNETTHLWTSYGSSHHVEAQFVIQSRLEGFVRFLVVEGEETKNVLLCNIAYVRSLWGQCEEENSDVLDWILDDSGTDMFYEGIGYYRADLQVTSGIARMKSRVLHVAQDYCLEIGYRGSAKLSIAATVNDTVLERRTFPSGSTSSQFSLNKIDGVKIVVEATNMQSEEIEFTIMQTKRIPERCPIACNFSLITSCSWSTENIWTTLATDDHLNMMHSSMLRIRNGNEISSTQTWDSNNWFCLKFRIDSIPAMCIQVGTYLFDSQGSSVKNSERILMTQCGPTLDFTTQCVPLPQQRPLQVFIRTTSKQYFNINSNIIINDILSGNVTIESVWTSSECTEPKMNCGWSQPSNFTVDAAGAFWNVINRETGPVLLSQTPCCTEETREEAVIWSPSFISNVSLDSKITTTRDMCLSFSYSAKMRGLGDGCVLPSSEEHDISSNLTLLLDHSANRIWTRILPKKAKGDVSKMSVPIKVDANKEHKIGFSSVLSSRISVEISDLTITDGECAAPKPNCNFDKDFCEWSNEGDDFYSWTWTDSMNYRHKNTGPFADCSLTRGGFVFANSSLAGETAHLVSPELPVEVGCVSFCYHMRGVGVGQLKVRMIGKESGKVTLLWSKEGNQGFPWHHVRIPIESDKGRSLKFTAIKGGRYYGDIAIDSIVFSEQAHCEKWDKVVKIPRQF